MNRKLYLLSQEYIQCYGVLNCLINIDGLEDEFVNVVVSKEVGKNE